MPVGSPTPAQGWGVGLSRASVAETRGGVYPPARHRPPPRCVRPDSSTVGERFSFGPADEIAESVAQERGQRGMGGATPGLTSPSASLDFPQDARTSFLLIGDPE